ncbi:MAG: tetratricopeptide repeat protein [bacterium]
MARPSNNKEEDPKLERYRKALEENPDSRYFAPLADALRKQGQIQEAIKIAEQGVKRNSRYESGLVVLAKSYLENDQLEEALQQFQLVTRLNPENVNAQKAIAEIYDNLGYHRQATQAYSTVTVLDPRDQNARQRLDLLEATAPPEPEQETPSTPEPAHDSTPVHGRAEEPGEEKTEELTPVSREEKSPGLPEEEEKFIPEPVADKNEEKPPETEEKAPRVEDVVITEPGKGETMPLFKGPPQEAERGTEFAPHEEEEKPEPSADKEDESGSREPVTPESRPGEEEPKPEQPKQEEQEDVRTESSVDTDQPQHDMEEKKLDMFFNGAKPGNLSVAEDASPFEPLSSPRFQVKIEKSNGGKMFWKQGHYQEALKIIAQDLWEAPYDQELREEFLKACHAMDRSPEAVLDEVIVLEDRKRKERQERPEEEEARETDSSPSEEEAPAGKEQPSEADLESRQKVETLKAYLSRIRRDKEKMP